jgi:SAM-dependent methyltransferase
MGDLRVDYDRIAPTYDRRFATESPRGTTTALLRLTQKIAANKVLEVGCGTGRWLADLTSSCNGLFGLDYSDGMLRQAQKREAALSLVRGRAGRLPFPDTAFDLVYCVNAIHHFDRQRVFVHEARRLLRPGGALAVLGFDPRQHRDKWYVFDYFEGTYETDLARFPSWGTVLDWMVSAGFSRVEWQLAERIWNPKRGGAVLEDPFLRKNASSQLVLLSDDAYAAGLTKIEAAVEAGEASGEAPVFPCEILIRMLVGRV